MSSVGCGTPWAQTFTYDAFGNVTKSGSLNWQPGYSSSTNRYTLGGTSYDSNGSLLNDTFHTYTWNGDGQVASIDSTSLTYDALGRQVERTNGSGYVQYVYSGSSKLALMNGQTLTRAFVPLPGGTQSVYTGSFSKYRVPDWLGSFRIESTSSRTSGYSAAFAPFGERYAESGSAAAKTFAGHNWDTVSDLYDATFREQSGPQGRWISPDPAGLAADPADPQTWNRYAYVLNNPLALVDPLGLNDCEEHVDCGGDQPGQNLFGTAPDLLGCGWADFWGGDCATAHRMFGGSLIRGGAVLLPYPYGQCMETAGDYVCWNNVNGDYFFYGGRDRANTATISAYHGSVIECLWQATVDAGEDLFGISMIPGTNQDNWEWSSAKFGFVYTDAAEGESLLSLSNGVDAVKRTADVVEGTPAAQAEIRQVLRNQGVKVSLKHVSKDAAILGKWAGRAAKVLAAKSAYDRYQKCRGY